jgi:hypothetical protein
MATQYVQGSQRSAQTWELLGRLVHASLQVGLYRVFPTTTTEDRLKQELRKRIWWMCFIMDKYAAASSTCVPRPPILTNRYRLQDVQHDIWATTTFTKCLHADRTPN